MFMGNTPLIIERMGEHDRFGQPTVLVSQKSFCSIVKLSDEINQTSPRMNLSASSGNADEESIVAKLMVNNTADIQIGDRLQVAGFQLKVVKRVTRNDIHGALHHWQVECSIWA